MNSVHSMHLFVSHGLIHRDYSLHCNLYNAHLHIGGRRTRYRRTPYLAEPRNRRPQTPTLTKFLLWARRVSSCTLHHTSHIPWYHWMSPAHLVQSSNYPNSWVLPVHALVSLRIFGIVYNTESRLDITYYTSCTLLITPDPILYISSNKTEGSQTSKFSNSWISQATEGLVNETLRNVSCSEFVRQRENVNTLTRDSNEPSLPINSHLYVGSGNSRINKALRFSHESSTIDYCNSPRDQRIFLQVAP